MESMELHYSREEGGRRLVQIVVNYCADSLVVLMGLECSRVSAQGQYVDSYTAAANNVLSKAKCNMRRGTITSILYYLML
jgi:hypothetical protein